MHRESRSLRERYAALVAEIQAPSESPEASPATDPIAIALAVFPGTTVVYRGPTMWPTWDGAPLVPAREVFPITTITDTTSTTTTNTEPVQGRLGMGEGQ